MSTRAGKAYHPMNGAVEEVWEGFSWPCFFLGTIWYIYKGMWGWALIAFLIAIPSCFVSLLVLPFYANAQHIKALQKRGYLTEGQWNDKQGRVDHRGSSVADELAKLAALKKQGLLTDEEFSNQKRRLLA